MADLPNKQAPQNGLIGLLQTIPSIAALFSSPTTTATSTTEPSSITESTSISKEGMDALIKQILDSNKGLAGVTQGQRSAGLYNSTSNSLLANDLITRAAGEVASRTASKTSTTTGGAKTTAQRTTAPISGGLAAGGLGALGLLSAVPALGKAKKGIEELFGEKISLPADDGTTQSILDTISGLGPALDAGSLGAASDLATETLTQNFLSDFDVISGAGNFFGDSLSFLGDIGPLPGIGSLLQGDVEGAAQDAAIYFAADAIFPGFGTAATVVSNVLGGDSVICTEALKQGLMSKELYAKETTQYFPTLSPTLVSGYHFLAAPVVHWMQTSSGAARFFAAGAVAYASHTTGTRKNLLGACIKNVGEPLCYAVGILLKKGVKQHAYT